MMCEGLRRADEERCRCERCVATAIRGVCERCVAPTIRVVCERCVAPTGRLVVCEGADEERWITRERCIAPTIRGRASAASRRRGALVRDGARRTGGARGVAPGAGSLRRARTHANTHASARIRSVMAEGM
ncbi:MAG: hypothetical protein KIT31_03270, partial [Deltaproteobacteria bacterium]|nr:hypothetical protein [Deltaproteobacteria bacterium]